MRCSFCHPPCFLDPFGLPSGKCVELRVSGNEIKRLFKILLSLVFTFSVALGCGKPTASVNPSDNEGCVNVNDYSCIITCYTER